MNISFKNGSLSLAAVVIATSCLAAQNLVSDSRTRTVELRKIHLDAWNDFVKDVPVGESFQDFTMRLQKMRSLPPGYVPMSPFGYQDLGGTGHLRYVYIIDDETQLRVLVDRHGKITETPSVEERGTWLRWPEGMVAPIDIR